MEDKILRYYIWVPIIFIIALGGVRIYYSLTSGFLSPDEALYFSSAYMSIEEGKFVWRYTNRYVFQSFLISLAFLFNVHDVMLFIFSMSVVFVGIGILNVFLFDRISRYLDVCESRRRWTVLLLGFCITFTLYVPFILTEPFSLMLCLAGILCVLNLDRGPMFSLLSGLFFIISGTERRPYLLFYVGNLIYVIYRSFKNKKWINVIAFLIPSCLGIFLFRFAPLLFRTEEIENICWVLTKSGNTVQPVNGMTYPRTPSELMDYEMPGLLIRCLGNYFTAILFGWHPILSVIGVVGILKWVYDERSLNNVIMVNGLLGYGALLGSWVFIGRFHFFSVIASLGLSIRFAHVTVSSFFAIHKAFDFIEPKKVFYGVVATSLVFAPAYVYMVQTNLSVKTVNRITTGYRAPWLRLRQYVENSGRTLVVCEPILRPTLFVVDNENVSLVWALNEEEFAIEYNNTEWDTILLYGEDHQLHWILLEQKCPWHIEQVYNRTGYKVRKIWWDNESYLLEVLR